MKRVISCSHCQQRYEVPQEKSGQVQCRKCGKTFVIPVLQSDWELASSPATSIQPSSPSPGLPQLPGKTTERNPVRAAPPAKSTGVSPRVWGWIGGGTALGLVGVIAAAVWLGSSSTPEESTDPEQEAREQIRGPGVPLRRPQTKSDHPNKVDTRTFAERSEARRAAGIRSSTVPRGWKQPGQRKKLQPVEYDDVGSTQSDLTLAQRSFHRKGMDWFLENSSEDMERKQKIVAFVDKFLAAWYPLNDDPRVNWTELEAEGRDIAGALTVEHDPMLTTSIILCDFMADRGFYNRKESDDLIKNLRLYAGPRRVVASVLFLVDEAATRSGNTYWLLSSSIANTEINNWIFYDFDVQGLEQRVALEILERLAVLRGARGGRRNVSPHYYYEMVWTAETLPPWIRHMIRARYSVDLAWKLRGSGFADTVSREGWAGFEQNIKIAAQEAQAAWKINPWFPEACVEMISCASVSQTSEDNETWFDRAVAAQPDYRPAYDRLYNFLRPQWAGNCDKMVAFGLKCYQTKRFDSFQPIYLIAALKEVVLNYDEDSGERIKFFSDPDLYRAVQDCMDKYTTEAEAHPESRSLHRPQWYRTLKAMMASRFGDKKGAVEGLIELGESLDESAVAFAGFGMSGATYRSSWYAIESKNGEMARKLSKLYEDAVADGALARKADEIRRIAEEGAEGTPDPYEKDYWNQFRDRLDILEAWEAGEWANIRFDPSNFLWGGKSFPSIRRVSDNEVIIDRKPGVNAKPTLGMRVDLPGPKIVEATFRSLEDTAITGYHARGIAFSEGSPTAYRGEPAAYINWDHQKLMGGRIGRRVAGDQSRNHVAFFRLTGERTTEPLRMRVQIASGCLQVFLNGNLVVDDRDPQIFPSKNLIVGDYVSNTVGDTYAISDVRVRKWLNPPTPTETRNRPLNAADHLKVALQEHSDFGWYSIENAYQLMAQGDWEQAASSAAEAVKLGAPATLAAPALMMHEATQGHNEKALDIFIEATENPVIETLNVAGAAAAGQEPSTQATLLGTWLRATHASEAIRIKGKWPAVSHPDEWVELRIQAAIAAANGRFDSAASTLELVIDDVPSAFREETQRQLDNYLNEELYFTEEGKPPFLVQVPLKIVLPEKRPEQLELTDW